MQTDTREEGVSQSRMALALSQFTVPLLCSIYRQFEGDMVAAIVLGEIAHRNVENWLNHPGNPSAPMADRANRAQVMRPCNALSIAEACGLPRETVRRKVLLLLSKALIDRDEAGHLYVTTGWATSYREAASDAAQALLLTAHRLQGLLAQKAVPLGLLQVDWGVPATPAPSTGNR